jgi:hypothetical protein
MYAQLYRKPSENLRRRIKLSAKHKSESQLGQELV